MTMNKLNSQKGYVVPLVIAVVILIAGGIYLANNKGTDSNSGDTNTTTAVATNDWKTYINYENGAFSIDYPSTFVPDDRTTQDTGYLIGIYDKARDLKEKPDPLSNTGFHLSAVYITTKSVGGISSFPEYVEKYPIVNGNNNRPFEFKTRVIGANTFYYTQTERFEGTLSFSYYIIHGGTLYRFDSVSNGVAWSDSDLDVEADSTHATLRKMLETFKFIK